MGFKVNIIKDAENELEDRLKNPFWWSFIISWISWNWKIWYITFFVSEEISGNRITYISNMYTYFDFWILFPFLGFILNWLIIPLILSIFIFFVVTEKIGHLFLKKKYELDEKEIAIKNNYLDKKSDSIDKLNEIISREEKLDKKTKQVRESKYEQWDKEYPSILGKHILILEELKFDHGGHFKDNFGTWNINKELFKDICSLGLFNFESGKNFGSVSEKGEYFIKKSRLTIKQ